MPEQFKTNPKLTAVAVSYRNPDIDLIADEVLPRVSTQGAQKFSWREYNEAQNFTVPNTYVGPRSEPNRVEIGGDEVEDKVIDYAIDVPLDNPTIKEAERNQYDPRPQAAQLATDIVMLDREVRVASRIKDPSNYHPDHIETLSGSDLLSDPDSDPLSILEALLDGCWVRPNQLVMGKTVWTHIRKHPRIVSAVLRNPGTEGRITRAQLAELLEISKVIVGESRVNINKPGLQPELHRTWGNFIAGHFINRSAASAGGLTFGMTATFGTRKAGTLPEPKMGIDGGILVRSVDQCKEVIISKRAGFLLQNAVDQ